MLDKNDTAIRLICTKCGFQFKVLGPNSESRPCPHCKGKLKEVSKGPETVTK